jgi:hypothetical protein
MKNRFMFVATGKSEKFAATRIYIRKEKTVAHD